MKYLIQQQIEQGIISHNKKLDSPKDYKATRLYLRLSKAKTEQKKQNIKKLIKQHFSTKRKIIIDKK